MSPKLRRRVAIVLLAMFFSLPLVQFNVEFLLELLFRVSYFPIASQAPVKLSAALFVLLEFIGLLFAAWISIRLWSRMVGNLLTQIQLRTGIVLTLVAALLLFLNTRIETWHGRFSSMGFPKEFSFYDDSVWWVFATGSAFNLFVALSVLAITAVICELVLWRCPRTERVSAGPPPEPTLNRMPLTERERWLYALPMFCSFTLLLFWPFLINYFNNAAAGRSIAWQLANDVARFVGGETLFVCMLIVGIALFYFKWVCQNRRLVIFFNIALFMILYFCLFVVVFAIVSPFFPYQCIRRRSRIGAPGGSKAVEDVRVGDAILCMAPDGAIVPGVVEAVVAHERARCVGLTLNDGTVLELTAEHPLAGETRWLPAEALTVGENVRTVEGLRAVRSITHCSETDTVYDLTVSPYPNFFANGVLVHNKLRKK